VTTTTYNLNWTTGPQSGNFTSFPFGFTTSAATLIQCFQDKFPEFDAVDVLDVVQPALDDASCWISESAWGKKYKEAVLLYAAHTVWDWTRDEQDGRGNITSEKVGPQSKAYASGTDEGDYWLSLSKYGRQFMSKRRLIFGARIC